MVAHSVGAVIAAAWVHDFAPPIRALVLATPAFRVKLYVPLAIPGLQSAAKGQAARQHPQLRRRPTPDPRRGRRRAATTPILSFRVRSACAVLLDLHDTSTRLLADAGAIRTPTLVLAAGSDAVVRRAPQHQFFQRLSSSTKRFEVLDGFSHAVFHERGRREVSGKVREFVDDAFARDTENPQELLAADQRGHTRREHDSLGGSLGRFSPKRFSFAAQRVGLGSFCRLSRGVQVGWRTGFDSGESLDYIYENDPRGWSPFGRLIDRQYLDAIGWRGIRQRKTHLHRMIGLAIERTHAAGLPVRLLDIAAGPGRYLLEIVRSYSHLPVTARLRDRSDGRLAAAAPSRTRWDWRPA